MCTSHVFLLEATRFIVIVSYRDTFFWRYAYRIVGLVSQYMTIHPKYFQFPKKMIALTYFETIFITNYKDLKCYWTTLITYMTNRGIIHRHCYLWDGFEHSSCDLCMKIVSQYISYREASIAIRIVSCGDCIVTVLSSSSSDSNEYTQHTIRL